MALSQVPIDSWENYLSLLAKSSDSGRLVLSSHGNWQVSAFALISQPFRQVAVGGKLALSSDNVMLASSPDSKTDATQLSVAPSGMTHLSFVNGIATPRFECTILWFFKAFPEVEPM